MASDEHKNLANFIKSTHNQLREESRLYGPMEAWERHLARTEVLKTYATNMRRLATRHWSERITETPLEATQLLCRNEWTRSQCDDYYQSVGHHRFSVKEREIAAKIGSEFPTKSMENREGPIELLDVGSCYDPLGSQPNFLVTAIDIAPSSESVYRCDFLGVTLADDTLTAIEPERTIFQLGISSFDAVLFSLFLEYLPCPRQRWECCAKAAALLRSGGLLLIVTPDSNHRGANARIIKSWRIVLARLGLVRIAYDKLRHLHCLAFRKCANASIATAWSRFKPVKKQDEFLSVEDKIYIPQDLRKEEIEKTEGERVEWDREELVNHFEAMPGSCDIFD